MTELARSGKLTPHQVDVFTTHILARVRLTMVSIAKQAVFSLDNDDFQMYATAYLNLKEEGADGVIAKMHPILAQNAFNALRRSFGLSEIRMKSAYDKMLVESKPMQAYANTVNTLYSTEPAFVSLAQETASGGDGTTDREAGISEKCVALFC